MTHGFDFSQWNSDQQFKTMSDQADFIFHKVTEGKTFRDPKGMARMKNYPKDRKYAIYHLVRPDNGNTPQEEAANFMSCIDELHADGRVFGIALDLEQNYVPYKYPGYLAWMVNLVDILHRRYDLPVICYMGDLYDDRWYTEISKAGGVFWIARWVSDSKYVKHKCVFWQQGSTYEGQSLDIDYMLGTEEEFLECMGWSLDPERVAELQREREEARKATEAAIDQMARDVIAGLYGCGVERKNMLYKVIQDRVNELCKL